VDEPDLLPSLSVKQSDENDFNGGGPSPDRERDTLSVQRLNRRSLFGAGATFLACVTGALINYATNNPWWWLGAAPAILVSVIYTYLQSKVSDVAAQDIATSGIEADSAQDSSGSFLNLLRIRIITVFTVAFALVSSVSVAVIGVEYARNMGRQAQAHMNIPINPSSYDTSGPPWTKYGPFYEAGPGLAKAKVTNAHVYGGGSGSIDYHVVVPAFSGSTANLSAYLSADEPQYHSSAADKYSDVELVINGTVVGVRRVTPDEGRGARYDWFFPARLIRVGNNDLSFIVKPDSGFPNGLCIYGEAVIPGYPDRFINLKTS
jgi:hypothetical protein